jgi:hypothetical protein
MSEDEAQKINKDLDDNIMNYIVNANQDLVAIREEDLVQGRSKNRDKMTIKNDNKIIIEEG